MDIAFSEAIVGSSTQAHWMLDGNVVTSVTPLSDNEVRLQTLLRLDDDPGGLVVYRSLSGTGYEDTCGNHVPDASVPLTDGIAPKKPVIAGLSVSDSSRGFLAAQDVEFFTNTNAPTFRVVNPADQMNRAVRAGYTIEIWEETNGSIGLQMDGGSPDTFRGSALVDGDDPSAGGDCEDDPAGTGLPGQTPACEVSVATDLSDTHAASGNQSLDVYAVAKDTRPASDGGPNVSVAPEKVVNLDFVAPVLSSITPEADAIRVTFSEPIPRGRNFGADWHSFSNDGSRISIASVSIAANVAERLLVVGSAGYDPDDVGYVQYFYVGPSTGSPSQLQYEDRATNKTSTSQLICLPAGSASGLC